MPISKNDKSNHEGEPMPISKNDKSNYFVFVLSLSTRKPLLVFCLNVNWQTTPIVPSKMIDGKNICQKPPKDKLKFFLSLLLLLFALSATIDKPEESLRDWIFAFLPTAIEWLLKK